MSDNWRKHFQDKTDSYKQPVPDISWSEIDKALEERRKAYAAENRGQSKRNMSAIWAKRIAAAAAFLLICVSTFHFVFNDNAEPDGTKLADNGKKTNAENKDNSRQPIADITSISNDVLADNMPAKTKPHGTSASVPPVASYATAAISESEPVLAAAIGNTDENNKTEEVRSDNKHDIQNHNLNAEPQASQKEDKRMMRKVSSNADTRNTLAMNKSLTAMSAKSYDRRISAGVYVQNITGGVFNINNTSSPSTYMSSMSDPIGETTDDMRDNSFPLVGYSDDKISDADHDMPIRAGVSVRYNIDDRWSIESGVLYSYLRSTLKSSSGDSFTQKLSYIGIPLTASYSIWRNSHVNTYITAGAMAEIMVNGKISSDEDGSISSRRLQWSISGSAGIEYNFNNTLGIYAEPGIRYYPDNHDGIINIYKDKPWNFNLSIGFRVNFR